MTTLMTHYRTHGRALPWRVPEPDGSFSAYKVLVSEIMLQQTQVARVAPKYLVFLRQFPDIRTLAEAPFSEVLKAWIGLGYNRRAKYLHQAAKTLVSKDRAWKMEDLTSCRGIGANTAAAVLAYSYNLPVLFVETNIRTVLIHHFFAGKASISDKVLQDTLDRAAPWNNGLQLSPREFYWAMMDYGAFLKASVGNLNRQSKAYTKQAAFDGSLRQLRGRLIRALSRGPTTRAGLRAQIKDDRLDSVLEALADEELVTIQGKTVMLYNR